MPAALPGARARVGDGHRQGSDPEGGELDYAWDLDGNGSFETPGQTITFSATTSAPRRPAPSPSGSPTTAA